jgi:pimeloyl-ACP methyl ester carboxylesterase
MADEASHRGGSGEPLVLIHGFADTWRVWKPVLPALEERHDVLVVGVAGHFECAPLPQGVEPSIDALIDALERDMDAAGFETAHLVGNSLGGWLALELARRGRARSVVAISPAGGWESGSREERRLVKLFKQGHKMVSWLGPRAERMARELLPDAEFRVLPKVGHMPMPDDPDLVARTILDFAALESGRLDSAPSAPTIAQREA